VKKVLLQLDTDQHPSPFDAIVAHDAGVDLLLSHGSVTLEAVRDLVQGAFFTRAPGEPSMAVWVGGSDVGAGEKILDEVQATYFGPFRVSAMLDSDGCNTTAATAIAMIARDRDLNGRRAVIVGVGPVGLRSATLLAPTPTAGRADWQPPSSSASKFASRPTGRRWRARWRARTSC
jgi:methylenetetrahydrofolate/methylenetetrahydromethanopterin dehydrogenase (NADP+)